MARFKFHKLNKVVTNNRVYDLSIDDGHHLTPVRADQIVKNILFGTSPPPKHNERVIRLFDETLFLATTKTVFFLNELEIVNRQSIDHTTQLNLNLSIQLQIQTEQTKPPNPKH
jgi:hypothetical protein